MNKPFFIMAFFVIYSTCLLANVANNVEADKIIKNGKVAICTTNMLYTPNGVAHSVNKYTCLVRNENKAFLDGKIYSADDYYTPYIEEYLLKLEEKKSKMKTAIQTKKEILKGHSGKYNPNNPYNKIGTLVNSSQQLTKGVTEIDNEIAKVKENYNIYTNTLISMRNHLVQQNQTEK